MPRRGRATDAAYSPPAPRAHPNYAYHAHGDVVLLPYKAALAIRVPMPSSCVHQLCSPGLAICRVCCPCHSHQELSLAAAHPRLRPLPPNTRGCVTAWLRHMSCLYLCYGSATWAYSFMCSPAAVHRPTARLRCTTPRPTLLCRSVADRAHGCMTVPGDRTICTGQLGHQADVSPAP
jgi:hypothetical protein